MLKDLAKVILTAKAAVDVIKEKFESKACDWVIQINNFRENLQNKSPNETIQSKVKEKAKEELFQLISEITHRAQINELQVKGFIKDKITELTNNSLLDSMELNDIRAEIAGLRAEIADLKAQAQPQKR